MRVTKVHHVEPAAVRLAAVLLVEIRHALGLARVLRGRLTDRGHGRQHQQRRRGYQERGSCSPFSRDKVEKCGALDRSYRRQPRLGTPFGQPRFWLMTNAREFSERAARLRDLADRVVDPRFAESLRQRAREWRALAAEIQVFEKDPIYRLIHDRQVEPPL